MKRLLKTFLLLALLSVAAESYAQSPRLVVWQKGGDKVYFELADLPETTFEGNLLVIRTSKTTVDYQLDNILRYTYENVPDNIELLPNERLVKVNSNGDVVTVQGMREGATARLYGADGMLLEERTSTGNRPVSFSIRNRPSGVYVVKAGSETVKMMKP
jgi:hypothetical protein